MVYLNKSEWCKVDVNYSTVFLFVCGETVFDDVSVNRVV